LYLNVLPNPSWSPHKGAYIGLAITLPQVADKVILVPPVRGIKVPELAKT
jgi:hypothetical protein